MPAVSRVVRWFGLGADGRPTDEDARGSVHEGAIAALARLGVVMGFEDGSLRADDPVTRAQLASIIVRQ